MPRRTTIRISPIIQLITLATRLTDKDKLIWRSGVHNYYETELDGITLATNWDQDDKPEFWVDRSTLKGYGLGIEGLRKSIYAQEKRHFDPSILESFKQAENALARQEREIRAASRKARQLLNRRRRARNK